MASVSISGGPERHMIVMLTIDSPRIIFALDHVFALRAFASAALASEEPPPIAEIEELDEDETENDLSDRPAQPIQQGTYSGASGNGSAMTTSFRVNIVDAQVILIANPTIRNTEAIVLGTKEVLLAKQNATTLQVTKVGMFLCRMDRFHDTRLRILDDFTVKMSMESRSQGRDSSLTSISIEIE